MTDGGPSASGLSGVDGVSEAGVSGATGSAGFEGEGKSGGLAAGFTTDDPDTFAPATALDKRTLRSMASAA